MEEASECLLFETASSGDTNLADAQERNAEEEHKADDDQSRQADIEEQAVEEEKSLVAEASAEKHAAEKEKTLAEVEDAEEPAAENEQTTAVYAHISTAPQRIDDPAKGEKPLTPVVQEEPSVPEANTPGILESEHCDQIPAFPLITVSRYSEGVADCRITADNNGVMDLMNHLSPQTNNKILQIQDLRNTPIRLVGVLGSQRAQILSFLLGMTTKVPLNNSTKMGLYAIPIKNIIYIVFWPHSFGTLNDDFSLSIGKRLNTNFTHFLFSITRHIIWLFTDHETQAVMDLQQKNEGPQGLDGRPPASPQTPRIATRQTELRITRSAARRECTLLPGFSATLGTDDALYAYGPGALFAHNTVEYTKKSAKVMSDVSVADFWAQAARGEKFSVVIQDTIPVDLYVALASECSFLTDTELVTQFQNEFKALESMNMKPENGNAEPMAFLEAKIKDAVEAELKGDEMGAAGKESVFLSKVIIEANASGQFLWFSSSEPDICIVEEGNARFTFFDWCTGRATPFSNVSVNSQKWEFVAEHPSLSDKKFFISRYRTAKSCSKETARGPLLTSGWSGVSARATDWRVGTVADLTSRWVEQPHDVLQHVRDTTDLLRRIVNKKTIKEQHDADCLERDKTRRVDFEKRVRAAMDPLLLQPRTTNASVVVSVEKMEVLSQSLLGKLRNLIEVPTQRYNISVSICGESQFANRIRVFDISMKKNSGAEDSSKSAILCPISPFIELACTQCVTKILFLANLQQGYEKQLVVQENEDGQAVVMVGGYVLTTVKQWRVGMVAFNLKRRALAISCEKAESVSVLSFDPQFRSSIHSIPPFSLQRFEEQPLRRMHLNESKELCLVFDNIVRFYDLSQKRMHTRKYELPTHYETLTNQLGSALFVVHEHTAEHQSTWSVRVIKCADGSIIANLPLSTQLCPNVTQLRENHISSLQILVVGGEEFLARVDKCAVYAERLELNFEEQRSKLSVWARGSGSHKFRDAGAMNAKTTPFDVIYDMYSKYAIVPTVKQRECKDTNASRHILVIPASRSIESTVLRDFLEQEVVAVLHRLKRDTCKPDVDDLHLDIQCSPLLVAGGRFASAEHTSDTTADVFLYNVAALVPVQIARAQNEGITILKEGAKQELDGSVSVQDVASRVSFGLYDLLLDEKEKPVVVISSMGKQSTGKSSMLNQLVGTCFDVSGARCTDGVWMSVRECEKFIIVVLDFEGVGSLERSAQEDMLLSVFNAAVSNATYFRTESRLDADVANIFSRMQQGAKLLSGGQDKESFTGAFHIVIKDVVADENEVKGEFINKIQTLCDKDKDNFFSTLYNGKINLIAFPCPKHADFYGEFNTLCEYIYDIYDDTSRRYENAFVFKQNCKLLLAKFAMKDWTPTDQNRCRMILSSIRKNLGMAITAGCSSVKSDGYEPLLNWRTNKPHSSAELPSDMLPPDEGLVLAELGPDATEDSFHIHVSETLIRTLALQFCGASNETRESTGTDHVLNVSADWKVTFEDFLQQCATRRAARIEDWMLANCANFTENGDVIRLKSETARHLQTMSAQLRLCSLTCLKCDMPCLLPSGHDSSMAHNCLTDHVCHALCTHCRDGFSNTCTLKRNHDGPHDCGDEAHVCGKECALLSFTNCMWRCALRPGHDERVAHACAATRHLCGKGCSHPTCHQQCVRAHDETHTRHECDMRRCPQECSFPECTLPCANDDHFHAVEKCTKSLCWCINDHPCPHDCEEDGICEIFSELRVTKKEFKGAHGSFSYNEMSEQNGIRKGCCKTIPAGQMEHAGWHTHDMGHNTVHYCDMKCPMCGYYCTKEWGHAGLHATTHGNMRHTTFVSEEDKCTLESRIYVPGESGKAEMCNMYCHAKGRGHIHVKYCEDEVTGADAHLCRTIMNPEDRRHSMKRYKPDVWKPKDEFTHAAFWEDLGFEDPCSEEDQKLFGLCPHICAHEFHQESGAQPSFCTGSLWHAPMTNMSSGSVSNDGHHFPCVHALVVHTIFCVDVSVSMADGDCVPQKLPWKYRYPNRLGCALEAAQAYAQHRQHLSPHDKASLILFGGHATCAVQEININSFPTTLETMANPSWEDSTSFSKPLLEAKRIADDVCSPNVPVVIVFLSDGEAQTPAAGIQALCEIQQRLQLHTVFFSSVDDSCGALRSMVREVKNKRHADAFSLESTFMRKFDAPSLEECFVGIADSLVPEAVQGEFVVNA